MRALHDQLNGLSRRGHEIMVWAPESGDRQLVRFHPDIKSKHLPIASPAPRRNIGYYGETSRFLRAMDSHCRDVAREMDDSSCDVVFVAPCRAVRTPPLARFLRTPSVLYLQEPYRPLYEAMPENPWQNPGISPWRHPVEWWNDRSRLRAMRLQVAEEIRSAKAFERILVNSRFSRESVLRAYGIDSTVCLLGIDASRFVLPHEPRGHVVGIGAFVPEKNIELAIDAVGLLPQPRPDLVWIGNVAQTSYLDQLRGRAHDRGVNLVPRIAIPETELVETLRTASCMLYAPRLEPFGYAPLEAGACGVPVVGVPEGGVRETIEHGVTGLLVDGGAKPLAEALHSVLADPELACRLGEGGRRAVEGRWSFDASIDRLEKNLLEVSGK